jgi:hypothetical protein
MPKSKDIKVREAVVGNPNTPVELLFDLGAEFPSRLLANPIFMLLLLEKPDLLLDIPTKTFQKWLQLAGLT